MRSQPIILSFFGWLLLFVVFIVVVDVVFVVSVPDVV